MIGYYHCYFSCISSAIPSKWWGSITSQIRHGPLPSTSLTFIYSLLMLSSVVISTEPLNTSFSETKRTGLHIGSRPAVYSSALLRLTHRFSGVSVLSGYLYHAFTQSLHSKAGMMHEGHLNNIKNLLPTGQKTQCVTITRTNRLMLHMRYIAIYCDNHS